MDNLRLLIDLGFVILTIIYLILFMQNLRLGMKQSGWDATRIYRTTWLVSGSIGIWLLFVSIWSGSGIMADFEIFPLNFMPIIAIPLVVVVSLVLFSKSLREILSNVPPQNFIRLQFFRVFVEILLWGLFVVHMLPEQMTFEGRNFDILAGLTSLLVAWLFVSGKINRTAIVIWNFACLGLLINIVTIAILSTPSPWRVFFEEPSNTIVTYFPVSWLPGFLVPLAYTLHFFSLKQMVLKKQSLV